MTSRHSIALVALLATASLASGARVARAQVATSRHDARVVDASTFVDASIAPSSSDAERTMIVDAAALRALGTHELVEVDRFPVARSTDVSLLLHPRRGVVDAGTSVRVGTRDGDVAGSLPAVGVFDGSIRGERGSRVFLVAVGDELYGYVERAGGARAIIGPSTLAGARDHVHVIAAESSFPAAVRDAASSCVVDAAERSLGMRAAGGDDPDDDGLLEVRVAVEADQEFYRRTGGTVEKATGYIVALWSMVSAMYEDEIGVTFRLPWIKVWTSPDPYGAQGNGYALWGTAPAYWRDHYQDVDRDLAHIFTASDWGGGGIAFRGEGIDGSSPVICSHDYGYAMSSPRGVLTYPTFAFTYDAYIVAHETGHNFGARHTHDCWWNPALDTCMTRDDAQFKIDDACCALPVVPTPSAGSIMSYCMGVNQKAAGGAFEQWKVNLTFTPRVAEVMREEAELAPCRRAPATPTIVLTSPRGKVAALRGDTTIAVDWKAVGVATYAVEYSADGMRSWRAIAPTLAADVLHLDWRVPRLCCDSLWVRVVDASNGSIGDTSLLPVVVTSDVAPPIVERHGDTLVVRGGVSHRWSVDGVAIPGATGARLVPATSGLYTVTVLDSNGCTATSEPVAVTLAGAGVDAGDDGALALEIVRDAGGYVLRYGLPRAIRRTAEAATIDVYDNAGRRVARLLEDAIAPGAHEMRWAADGLVAGTYWVSLRAAGAIATERAVVR
jgi:hypothetical protein